jgi:glyoxylase-like metal-dependent hydrolase (beta-lactamase superfamily II)
LRAPLRTAYVPRMHARIRHASLAALIALGACTRPASGPGIIAAAAAAMGGADRIAAAKALVVEGTGDAYALGQNATLDGPLLRWHVTDFRRRVDFEHARWREESVWAPAFDTGWPSAFPVIEAYDGGVPFGVESGTASRRDDVAAIARRAELHHDPIGFLRAATAPGARLEQVRAERGGEAIDLVTAEGERYTLVADSATHLPKRIISKGTEPALGDVAVVTELDAYKPFDGLQLPTKITRRIDTTIVAVLEVAKVAVHSDTASLGDLAAPASVRSAPVPPGDATVTVNEAAPGVWYLTGEGPHSIVIEFRDHLTLVEAPEGDRRTLAVIRQARALRPGKPLTEVINTHHHFDHSGGLRAAVSEGLKVITQASNRAFVEAMVARPSTVVPDALAKNPKPLAIETVDDRKTLSDGTRTLELYRVDGNAHCPTMLMVHLPRERLLIEADAYQPPPLTGTPPVRHPFAGNLLANIERRHLRVDRLLPIHGRMVPFAALVTAAATSDTTR